MKKKMLMASFGKVIITPEEDAPLQGYDPSKYIANPMKDKMDELFAKIAVLDDGNQRVVIISVDCCITNEIPFQATDPSGKGGENRKLINTFPLKTRKLWADAAETNESFVSVMATHTHSAPAHFSEKYTSRIASKINEVAKTLCPVTMSIAAGKCTISANRRPRLQPNFDLPVDQTLNVAMFYDENRYPLGAFVNCAVHPTVLLNPTNRISGDIIGVAMNELENHMGKDFTGLFIQGFSGDICPASHDRKIIEDTYPLVQKIGHALYKDIIHTTEHLQNAETSPLVVQETIASLPTHEKYYKPFNDVTIRGIRIGDLGMLSVSAEVFNGYVDQLKSIHPFRILFCAGVANGYSGYLPTAEAYEDQLGGYEMNTTTYDKSAVVPFVNATVKVIAGLHE